MMSSVKNEKQKLSELRRLEANKQRRVERNNRQRQITISLGGTDGSLVQNKKIVFHSDEEEDDEKMSSKVSNGKVKNATNTLTLFESSGNDDDDEDDEAHRFEIKSQFEGERGKQLFEMSSAFTDERFKLDERFKENDEYLEDLDLPGSPRMKQEEEIVAEKEKNLEILERVLGFQVPKKPITTDGEKRKKIIRFDPESEDASKFIRKSDPEEEKKRKTKNKKNIAEQAPISQEPVVSSERYFEVVGDLKEILSSSTPAEPFSFKHHFGSSVDNETESADKDTPMSSMLREHETMLPKSIKERGNQDNKLLPKRMQRGTKFFLGPDDARLKDGVEDFHRTLSFEEIRKNWLMNREMVIELFRKNRRAALRNPKSRSRSFQQMNHQRMKHRKFSRT